jgi:hypothetical protein
LSAEFEKLPDAAKRSIAGLAQIAGRLSNDLQSGKADASALNQVLDRLEASVRSLSAAEQQREAAAQARQRVLAAEIAQNDRLITQERELAAARQADIAASRQQESGSLDAAEQALIGPRRMQERPLNEVYDGLGQQAQAFRGAVDSTFGLPQFGEFRDQARRAGAEIQSIRSEIQRLSTLDPQRDAAEYADAWGRVGTRVRAVSDMMAAGTRLAQTAAGGAPPEPPEIIDRNQDRLGAFSPMDRNADNIGARTSLGGQGARTDISDMGRMSSLEDRRRDLARQAIGEDIEAPRRQLAALASSITSVKSQIDTLPDGLRTRFVPAIREAEAEFIRLSAAPAALPNEIEAARQRLIHLTQDATRAAQAMNFSQSFGGAGVTGLNLGLDQRALQGYNAQLQILQGAIGRASTEARGPAVAAFNRLRNAIAEALDGDNLDSEGTRARLAALRGEAIAAAAAVSRISVGTLRRNVDRAGDVGRGGFDNFSLALNQAAFAVDDFMSSTGGLEFKLRAVSNNITQLAFILGGTAGLFVGLGAVIAGQAAVGLLKWINNGKTAEDQTKSLNAALEQQKSLADALADSFRALGASLSSSAFSKAAADQKAFADSLRDLRDKQSLLRDQQLGALTPEVQSERALQTSLRARIEKESDPSARVGLQMQASESERREKAAVASARATPVSADELMPKLSASGQNTVRDTQGAIAQGFSLDLNRAMRQAVSEDIKFAKAMGGQDERVQELEVFLRRLEDPVQRAIDALALGIASAARGPAAQIAAAQQEVVEAIKLGVPGARLFEIQLNKNAEKLSQAYAKLEEAAKEQDKDTRVRLVRGAEASVRDVEEQQFSLAQQADAIRTQRIVDPQQQVQERMSRARANLGAAGLDDGRLARRMREIDADRATIEERSKLPAFQTPEMVRGLQDAEQALNEEAAAIEAATIAIKAFSDALNRASEEAKGNLNSAQQAADEARRADLGNSTPQTQEARRQAEADLERQREIERAAQTEIAVERDRLEQMQRPDAARLGEIDEQLKSGVDNGDREALIREREAIRGRIEDEARVSQDNIRAIRDASTREEEERKRGVRGADLTRTPEERFRAETEQGLADIQTFFERRAEANNGLRPQGDIEAQAAAEDRFRKDREREARTATAAGRGAELGMTPEERFRRDFKEGAGADINARAKELRDKGEDPTKFLRQALANQMESVAPMLQGFQEERQNALLQGPSRAALNVSDVSTSQGASELTRLIRGDDSAKDVNLAELSKQTGKLQEIVDQLKANNPGVLL